MTRIVESPATDRVSVEASGECVRVGQTTSPDIAPDKPRLQPPHYTPLDLVESCLARFISYPSEHARVAHVLWISHCWLMDLWDTSPRLALMSAEKASGKTRGLEITALLVPTPILSISTSPAAIIRLIAKERPTLLADEIDAVFGNAKAQEANADLRSVLNGGYRRGAKVYRCTANGKKIGIEALDAFCAVAVAGLRELPDTIASRAIIIRMKRRAPDEVVTPFRYRYHEPEAKPIKEALEEWCKEHEGNLTGAEPEMPAGIEDRAADCWEPLLAIADEAGDDWPDRARAATVYLTRNAKAEAQTKGVELLEHIREAFGEEDRLWTEKLLRKLCDRDESPWRDTSGGRAGKEMALNDRGLATRLKQYGIRSRDVRIGDMNRKGYLAEDFFDAWARYCPSTSDERDKRYKRDILDNKNNFVADVADVAAKGEKAESTNGTSAELEIDDADYAFEERAAILEHDAGLDREEAEAAAAKEMGLPGLPRFLVRRKEG